MKCPECLNRVENHAATCRHCGCRLGFFCGACGAVNRLESKFCCECGRQLQRRPDLASCALLQSGSPNSALSAAHRTPTESPSKSSERKLVTVLFSDLSGYSNLCERLDPEDVREMMNLVFREIVGIIVRYEGYIDRIIGDEVLAVFGVPRTHEDDPVRAVRASLEIHAAVARMSERFGEGLEKPLAMHSGIATGLVVTGETEMATGRHGITGDTVNRAAMLTSLAAAGEILVGPCTMRSTSGFFLFEKRQHQAGEGPDAGVEAYRVLDREKRPDKIRRLQGVRSRLIGRETEMHDLREALSAVSQGAGRCLFLAGDAGMGKSRLIAEFRRTLAVHDVRWLQGNAFIYTQGVPYYPLIDLLGRAVDVRQQDSESVVRHKLIRELSPLEDDDGTIVHTLERLFTPSTDDASRITPEAWKIKLRHTLIQLISNQSRRGPTVICLEDLHWADPSTVDLFRMVLNEADLPVLFLISYRPGRLALDHSQITNRFYAIQTILLEGLSPQKSEVMVKSLLSTDAVPKPLQDFVAEHLGGNPFFLEELINSLIENGTLNKLGNAWKIDGPIGDAAFSSNIASVIAARIDLLGDSTKRIVQEASVIGRQFSPVILKQISSHPDVVNLSIVILKALGMILDSDDPVENAYLFKHSLVQEVAYNSLLKRQRRDLHEKIALVLENQGSDRMDALCEILAYHFSNGHSLHKAVEYLRRSGRKGLKKFAVVESHNYYEKAYRLLSDKDRSADDAGRRTVELLLEWFFVFNVRGRYGDALNLFKRHESVAMNQVDLHLKGMYLACLGWAYQRREQLDISRNCLLEALSIGEQTRNYKVIAYSYACLIWTCTDLGRLDEALAFASKAEAASQVFESEDPSWSFEMDQDLVRFVLTGTAIAHWFKGDCRQCRRLGDRLLAFGAKAGDVNSVSEGHLAHGMGCFAAGDYRAAIENCLAAIDSSADPLYSFNARFLMAYAHLSLGEIAKAEKNLGEIMTFCSASGYEYIGTSANTLSSVVAVGKGDLGSGIRAIGRQARQYLAEGKHYHAQTFHYMLGSIYLKIILREGELGLSTVIKNLPFLIAHLPRAAGHAERHFRAAIRMSGEINALGIKGQALLDLARLYLYKRKKELALPLIQESVALFEKLGADRHLERAQDVLRAVQ